MAETPSVPSTAPSAGTDRALAPHRLAVGVAVAVCVLGVAAVLASRSLDYWTSLGPGPGFFPTWLGLLLAVGGLLWTVSAVRELRRDAAAPAAAEVDEQEAPPEYSPVVVLAIVGSLCVLAAVLETVGYQLSMLLFLLFHLLVLGRRRLLLSLVIAVAGSFGVYWVFTALLGVPLPVSTLPGLAGLGL